MSQPYTPERVAVFAKPWRGGLSIEHIGVALDLQPRSVVTVASRLRRRGVDLPHRRSGRTGWTPDRVSRAARAVSQGADRATLAAVMGVSEASVGATLSLLRRLGHDVPQRGH